MDVVAPLGPVYQAGTLSGNPLAMAAGLATLCQLRENPQIYSRMEANSAKLVAGITEAGREAGFKIVANRVGSMFTWFFCEGAVTNWDTAAKADAAAFGRFHRNMLEAGVWLPPSQFEAAFLSAAHGEQEIEDTIAAAREAFALVTA
jgi:glutamate-1-semialdehyde 2,1-aminomutase